MSLLLRWPRVSCTSCCICLTFWKGHCGEPVFPHSGFQGFLRCGVHCLEGLLLILLHWQTHPLEIAVSCSTTKLANGSRTVHSGIWGRADFSRYGSTVVQLSNTPENGPVWSRWTWPMAAERAEAWKKSRLCWKSECCGRKHIGEQCRLQENIGGCRRSQKNVG